jgi:acylphosphatase
MPMSGFSISIWMQQIVERTLMPLNEIRRCWPLSHRLRVYRKALSDFCPACQVGDYKTPFAEENKRSISCWPRLRPSGEVAIRPPRKIDRERSGMTQGDAGISLKAMTPVTIKAERATFTVPLGDVDINGHRSAFPKVDVRAYVHRYSVTDLGKSTMITHAGDRECLLHGSGSLQSISERNLPVADFGIELAESTRIWNDCDLEFALTKLIDRYANKRPGDRSFCAIVPRDMHGIAIIEDNAGIEVLATGTREQITEELPKWVNVSIPTDLSSHMTLRLLPRVGQLITDLARLRIEEYTMGAGISPCLSFSHSIEVQT